MCGSCHGRNAGHVELEGRYDPIVFEMGDNVYDYTNVLSLATNQNVWANIEDGEVEEGSKRFFEDGGSRSHRMQFNDMEQGPHYPDVACTDCHDMHGTNEAHSQQINPEGAALHFEFEESCAECHGEDEYDPEEYMPIRPSSSNVEDQRNHTFLPGGKGDPAEDIPETTD